VPIRQALEGAGGRLHLTLSPLVAALPEDPVERHRIGLAAERVTKAIITVLVGREPTFLVPAWFAMRMYEE